MKNNKIFFFLIGCLWAFAPGGYAQTPVRVAEGTAKALQTVSQGSNKALDMATKASSEIIQAALADEIQKHNQVMNVPIETDAFMHLYRRVHETWLDTYMLQSQHTTTKRLLWPSQQLSKELAVNPYPADSQAGQLPTPELWSRYFLINNNLETRKWVARLAERQKEVTSRLEDFLWELETVTHPAQEDMKWLVHQISADTQYLLLGEIHHHPEIQLHVEDFLRTLRMAYPRRQIFLFTEFIAQDQTWGDTLTNDAYAPYIPIWLTANSYHIPIVGLEPTFVRPNDASSLILQETAFFPPELQLKKTIWGSVEGLRLRNTHWIAKIQEYRQQYPDALFVIHGGAAHMDYMMPYSVSKALAGPHTLNISLVPADEISEFDQMTNGLLPQRILKFNNPELSHLAGFDIQIKIDQERP